MKGGRNVKFHSDLYNCGFNLCNRVKSELHDILHVENDLTDEERNRVRIFIIKYRDIQKY